MSDPNTQAPIDSAAPAAPVVTEASSPAPVAAPTPSDSSAAASAQPTLAPATSLLTETLEPAKAPDPAPAPEVKAPEVKTPDPAADPKPADAPVADPAAPPEAPVAPPTYEFKLPEEVQAAPEQLAKLNELIGGLEVDAKLDHGKAQEFGQKALDYHLSELQRVATEIDQQGRQAWTEMRETWRNTFKSDPELGGNRQQTTLAACTRIIDQFGGNDAQRAELRTILGTTGAGDHPALIRLLANVGKALGEGRPVPAVVPKSPVVPSRKERRYHSNGAA
jgi:hypothetical protein